MNVNQTQTLENYVKNPRREKSRSKRGEIPLNLRDYKEFSKLYYKYFVCLRATVYDAAWLNVTVTQFVHP